MVKCEGEGKFLGLPYLVGSTKKQNFQLVKELQKKVGDGRRDCYRKQKRRY